MDNPKRAFVCKKCGMWGYASKSCFCKNDGIEMTPIPYRYAEWESMSAEDQSTVIRYWMRTSKWIGLSNNQEDVQEEYEQEKVTNLQSNAYPTLWISLLRAAAYLLMILGILSSVIYGITLLINGRGGIAPLGIIVIIGGCLLSILSVAGIMVFLDIAMDIRKVRTLMENDRKK